MRNQNIDIRFGGPLTPMVKKLLLINGGVFLIQIFSKLLISTGLEPYLGLSYIGVMHKYMFWQIFTYMFLHSTISFFHIIFNMLSLWMFGGDLEGYWGSNIFIKFYIICGIGAGFFILFLDFLIKSPYSSITIGASGAIFGIFLAYAMIWPNREVYVFAIFPVKVKYLITVMILIAVLGVLQPQTNISHIGHLGGLLTAFFYIRFFINRVEKPVVQSKKTGFVQGLFKKNRLQKKQKEIDTRIEAKKIIDELLEKIAREGMSSLTSEEKKRLEWARKHYYPERKDTLH